MTLPMFFKGPDIVENDGATFTSFNVTASPYNGVGDNSTDDTAAIRAALAAAIAHASTHVEVYLPTGTYKSCRAGGDAAWPAWPILFNVDADNKHIRFRGDGKALSVISCFMPSMADPTTTWVNTGDGFVKIARFTGFEITGTNLTVDFVDLTVDGNADFTGDHTVGGNTTTGDGWDISHKGVRISSGTNMAVNGTRTAFRNWRGEVWWGGNHNCLVTLLDGSEFTGSNASALSVTHCYVDACTIGGASLDNVYNGIENFAMDGEATVVLNSTIIALANGIVPIGDENSTCTITGNTIQDCNNGILVSEGAWDMLISDNQFVNCDNGIINSLLGLYPGQTDGFGRWTISGNTQSGGGSTAVMLNGQGQTIQEYLTLEDNTVTTGALLGGSFNATVNFTVDGTIFNGGKDVTSFSGIVPVWSGSVRPNVTTPVGSANEFASAGNQVNVFGGGGTTTGNFAITTDLVALNDNQSAGTMTLDLTNIANIADGHIVTIKRFGADDNWFLLNDATWNNWGSPLAVSSPVMLINVAGIFEVAP